MGDIQSLKEILLDAARYRWIRKNLDEIDRWEIYGTEPDEWDAMIDEELEAENE